MRALRAISLSTWRFVVGDDWRAALGVVAAIGATALLASAGASAWWLLPAAVVGLLAASLDREHRRGGGPGPSG